jgi:putative iron-dependent peroxidase
VTKKWGSNLPKSKALPVGDQERVIGLTHLDSTELEGDAMPRGSNVSHRDVKLDRTRLQIFNHSAPFNGASETGLYYIAFSCDPMRFDLMQQRIFGTSDDDLHNQHIHYSTLVSGTHGFAPCAKDVAANGCAG